MEWTIEQGKGTDYFAVATRGAFDVDDHRRMVKDIISRDFWRPGMSVLFDHRALDFGDTGYAEMRKAADNHLSNDICIGEGKAAILMKSLADYGRGRQFELLTEGQVSARMQVFLDEAQAVRWLLEE